MKEIQLRNSTVNISIHSAESKTLKVMDHSSIAKLDNLVIAQLPVTLVEDFVITDSIVRQIRNVSVKCRTFINSSSLDSMGSVFLSRASILNTDILFMESFGLRLGEGASHILENVTLSVVDVSGLIIEKNAEYQLRNVTIENCVEGCLEIDESATGSFERVKINGKLVSKEMNLNYIKLRMTPKPEENRLKIYMNDSSYCVEHHGYKRTINCDLGKLSSYMVRVKYSRRL